MSNWLCAGTLLQNQIILVEEAWWLQYSWGRRHQHSLV